MWLLEVLGSDRPLARPISGGVRAGYIASAANYVDGHLSRVVAIFGHSDLTSAGAAPAPVAGASRNIVGRPGAGAVLTRALFDSILEKLSILMDLGHALAESAVNVFGRATRVVIMPRVNAPGLLANASVGGDGTRSRFISMSDNYAGLLMYPFTETSFSGFEGSLSAWVDVARFYRPETQRMATVVDALAWELAYGSAVWWGYTAIALCVGLSGNSFNQSTPNNHLLSGMLDEGELFVASAGGAYHQSRFKTNWVVNAQRILRGWPGSVPLIGILRARLTPRHVPDNVSDRQIAGTEGVAVFVPNFGAMLDRNYFVPMVELRPVLLSDVDAFRSMPSRAAVSDSPNYVPCIKSYGRLFPTDDPEAGVAFDGIMADYFIARVADAMSAGAASLAAGVDRSSLLNWTQPRADADTGIRLMPDIVLAGWWRGVDGILSPSVAMDRHVHSNEVVSLCISDIAQVGWLARRMRDIQRRRALDVEEPLRVWIDGTPAPQVRVFARAFRFPPDRGGAAAVDEGDSSN